jgi:DnaJ-class molecular chaperone
MNTDEWRSLLSRWCHSERALTTLSVGQVNTLATLLAQYETAQQSVQADECPRCAGKGKVLDGLVTGKCLQCNGTGIRR